MRGFSKTSLVSVMLAALSGVLPGVDYSSQNIFFPLGHRLFRGAKRGCLGAADVDFLPYLAGDIGLPAQPLFLHFTSGRNSQTIIEPIIWPSSFNIPAA